MAKKEVLSKEEIDALLETVDNSDNSASIKGKKSKSDAANDHVNQESFIALNFNNQAAITKGQLPVLGKIYDRAARLFVTDIYNLTAKDFEIKQEPLQIVKHREFMGSLPNPSLMSIYKFKPLRGKGMVLFDSTFVYDLVDYYFGGTTQFFAQKDKVDYTATELRVMDTVTKKFIANLSLAWRPILTIDITKFNEETNPELVNIAEPDEMLLVARFNMDFGKEVGSFYLIIPYSMVEPIKQQLELGASNSDDEIDPNWIKSLKEELMEVELTVSSTMAQTNSTLGNVMSLQVGDFISLEKKDEVTLDIDGTPSFTATLGSTNDKRALKIIKVINY